MKKYHTHKKVVANTKRAFTLMEVMLAIAMISLLSFLVVTNVDKLMGSTQTKTALMQVKSTIPQNLMTFNTDCGRYPTTEEGLKALIEAPAQLKSNNRWEGPYITELPKDPWGNPYQYRYPSQKSNGRFKYDLWSMGPDGQNETEDDIGNWITND